MTCGFVDERTRGLHDGKLANARDQRARATLRGKTFAQLPRARRRPGRERIPTLREGFETVDRRGAFHQHRTSRERPTAGPVRALIAEFVRAARLAFEDFSVSSSSRRELRAGERPEHPIALLLGATSPGLSAQPPAEHRRARYKPEMRYVTPRCVDVRSGAGLKVFVYTVNAPARPRTNADVGRRWRLYTDFERALAPDTRAISSSPAQKLRIHSAAPNMRT